MDCHLRITQWITWINLPRLALRASLSIVRCRKSLEVEVSSSGSLLHPTPQSTLGEAKECQFTSALVHWLYQSYVSFTILQRLLACKISWIPFYLNYELQRLQLKCHNTDWCQQEIVPKTEISQGLGQRMDFPAMAALASSRADLRMRQMAAALVMLASSLSILQLTSACGGSVLCPNNLCCSQYGYCGQTSAYCGTGCQSQCSYAAPKGVLPGKVLFDYLGSNGVSITYSDIPVSQSDLTWVLILAFAIDMSSTGATQNGNHSVYWNPSLTQQAAKTWRAAHSNGRIVIGIGGSQLYTNSGIYNVNWYDPPNTTQWLANAVSSITTICQAYGCDGIDIDIENFPNGVGATFQSLIGQLITTLKNNHVISFVSMAPGYDQLARYTALYNSLTNSTYSYIDTVNYQFYGEGLNTCAKYEARYNQVIQSLPANIVSLSTQVSGDNNTITGPTFYNCVTAIKNSSNIAGVMLWNADLSKRLNNNFSTETSVAAILLP